MTLTYDKLTDSYVSEEYNITWCSRSKQWKLRNKTGAMLDVDRYPRDLAARHGLTIQQVREDPHRGVSVDPKPKLDLVDNLKHNPSGIVLTNKVKTIKFEL